MKKLPKVDKFDLSNDIHNNKQIFNSLEDKVEIKENENNLNKNNNETLTVKEKVKELIKANNYIFNTKVKLIFEDKEKICNIAGVVNNHLITMDNEIIKIDDLKDIIY